MKNKSDFKETEIGVFPSDWEIFPIQDIALIKSGKRLPKGNDVVDYNTGFPYIRVRDLQNMSVKTSEVKFLEPSVQNSIKRYIITDNDIYISIVGTIGLVGTVPKELNNANLTENCARLTDLKINRNYLKYFLNSKCGQNQISSLTVGTTQGKLALSRIAKILVPTPSAIEQESIANILSSLDSKIELNQQMNQTLEEIAQALFKRWFVDFEFPDEKGRPYKSSGGKMVWSEELQKEIPEKWSISTIGAELKTILGGTPSREKKEYWVNGIVPWINSGEINTFPIIDATEHITKQGLENSATKLMPKRTVVLPFVISVGKNINISILGNEMCGNQSVLGILESQTLPAEYIYYWVEYMKENIYSWATGGAQQHINKKNVDQTVILLPDKKLLASYSEVSVPIFNSILNNATESKNLSQIRDSLLPKLMSGKIRVHNA